MRLRLFTLLILSIILSSCEKQDGKTQISLSSKTFSNTLYISELITKKPITKLNSDKNPIFIELEQPILSQIFTKDKENSYLTILAPHKKVNIWIKSDSTIITNDKGDSIVNYLQKNTLDYINENSSFIFKTQDTDSIVTFLEDFGENRSKKIDRSKKQLSPEILDLLHFQNNARIYSFLFWLGRTSKKLDPKNGFFDFIEKIPKPTETLKSLPDIYLYKYEIEYLREHPTIEDIPHFLRFIENKTANNDLADFLKAIYIRNLIENPSYWEKHEGLFDSVILSEVLESEKKNAYYYIIEQPSSSFYASQKGEEAYFFEATDKFGNNFSLEELRGKIVFIDVWATWCGPCINQRPRVIEFAKKHKNSDKVEILMVSVDSSKDKWSAFLEKENGSYGTNLFIKNGMRAEFGKRYNIYSIPKYILIDKDGTIINSNLSEPSMEVEKAIEEALSWK